MTPIVRFVFEDWADADVPFPEYQSAGAAGADVRANLPADSRGAGLSIDCGQRLLVPTGLRLEIPKGYEVQVRPRSGLALKAGITVANSPGTIDSDYRGPLGVILINFGDRAFMVGHGERIAQLVVAPVARAAFSLVQDLDETARGGGGFGSTGQR